MKTPINGENAKKFTKLAKDRLHDLEEAIEAFDGSEEAALSVRLNAGFLKVAAKAVVRSMTSNA